MVGGTLGDALIIGCKARARGITQLLHYTKHAELWPQILVVYGLFPEISVKFSPVDGPRTLTTITQDGPMEFFPWEVTPKYARVVVPSAGRKNHRNVPIETRHDDIILGTNPQDKALKGVNFVGQTTLSEALYIAIHASTFVGMEGVLAYAALASKVKSTIYYKSYHAVKTRIVSTPWENYAKLLSI